MPRKPARKNKKRKIKNTRKNKKIIKKVKHVITLSLVFLVSLTFLSGYFFYKKITQEYASAFSSGSYEILNESLYTIAYIVVEDFETEPVIAKRVEFVIIDENTLKLIKYQIPVELEIDVPGIFGKEKISKILALDALQNNNLDDNSKLMCKALYKLLGFPIDRYLLVTRNYENTFDNLLSGRLSMSSDLDIPGLTNNVKTNLSLQEFFATYKFASTLPEDRIISKKLSNSYIENLHMLDEEFMDLTFESNISKERKSIAVLNGTEFNGIANFGSRVVKNVGGRVVATGNARDMYDKSIIIVDDINSESVRVLRNIFEINEVILHHDAIQFRENEIDRSDITIIFGLDFAQSL